MSDKAIIYTDGACSNNGAESAQGGIGVHWEGREQNNISEPLGYGRQTNQRAEIEAARRGIEQARDQGYRDVTVRTDSEYVRKGVESWMPKWERDGWSKNVVNKEEFQALKESMRDMDVKFERVPSHQNKADGLAKDGAKRAGNMCRRFLR